VRKSDGTHNDVACPRMESAALPKAVGSTEAETCG
jgi:hypothetical protein